MTNPDDPINPIYGNVVERISAGLTIRAYIATQCMASMVGKIAFDQPAEDMMKEIGITGAKKVEAFVAMLAVDQADALIEALNRKSQ